jgi:hypothetical protein
MPPPVIKVSALGYCVAGKAKTGGSLLGFCVAFFTLLRSSLIFLDLYFPSSIPAAIIAFSS